VPEGRQPAALDRSSLRADCARCFGLCCVAPAFTASADFAISKPAGQPCPNLDAGFGCSIHDRLRQQGFAGCTVYDCFGAGQKVAQVTFGGQDWRETPGIAQPMFAAFAVVRQLHELLWYLSEALTLEPARPVYAELRPALEETERLTRLGSDALTDLDVNAYRRGINALLLRASELTRAEACRRQAGLAGADLRGADLIGKDLRKSDLRGASLRGAYLLGANLAGVDLAVADLTGADLRGADLRGADLSGSLFVAQSQVDAATGNAATRLPSMLTAPSHWPT
jgi:hypothetical protein